MDKKWAFSRHSHTMDILLSKHGMENDRGMHEKGYFFYFGIYP